MAEENRSEGRMPFTDHLGELRTRLFYIVLGYFICSMIAFMFRAELFAIIARPLVQVWQTIPAAERQLVFTSPIEPFMVLLKVSLLAAVFVELPWIFVQLWMFIAPGLYPRERKYAVPFILAAVLLFVGGASFAYFYVVPAGYEYFVGGHANKEMGIIREILGQQIEVQLTEEPFRLQPMLTMKEYLSLTSMLLLVFGAVFELPLLLSVLAMLGIVTPGALWRFNRYAILIAFVAGAALTPGDLIVGQVAMGGSLVVLYNLSILAALLFQRRKPPPEESDGDGDGERADDDQPPS